jgi:hypothetical protein
MKNFTKGAALLLALAGSLLLFGCSSGGDDDGDPEVAVTGVSLSLDNPNIVAGSTRQLGWVVEPADATNKNVIFTSDNTNAATVNNRSGLVTAKAAGTAVITVTTEDGSKTDKVTVTVAASAVPVTGLSFTPDSGSISVGGSIKLNLEIAPVGATSDITWESGATGVATVKDGVVTGVSAGTATITATADSQTASFTATVIVPEKKLTVTGFPASMNEKGYWYSIMLTNKVLTSEELSKYISGEEEPDVYANSGQLELGDDTSIITEAALEASEAPWTGDGEYYIYIGIVDEEAQSLEDYFVGVYRSKKAIAFETSTEVRELKFADFQTVPLKIPEALYESIGGWFFAPYSVVTATIEDKGWDVTHADSKSAYATGDTADLILEYVQQTPQINFQGYASEENTFENLLNFKNEGIGLPSGLKTGLRNDKDKAPLLGIFGTTVPGGQDIVIVFYVDKS